MPTMEEEFEGFVISWEAPPPTTGPFTVSIGSNDIDLARLLAQATGEKGTHLIIGSDRDTARRAAREFIAKLVRDWR